MSNHYGNIRVYGKVISDSISGSQLDVDHIDASSIDVGSIVINGTLFDPNSISITGDVDLGELETVLESITGDVGQLQTDVTVLSGAIDNISEESTVIESSGGSVIITQDGPIWNLEVATISGGGGPIPNHNGLVGLQGGNGSTEYFHLSSSQYSNYIGSTEVYSISGDLYNLIIDNTGDISTLQSDVSTNSGDISTLQSDVSTNTSDISTLQSDVSTNTGDISTNATNISTNSVNIAANASDISDLQNEVDSIQVSAGGGLSMAIYSNLTGDYTITDTDREIYVGFDTTTGKRTVTMNSSPSEGDKVFVKDENMFAYTNNITIDGNGNNIDCCATYDLTYNNAGVLFIFAGAQWRAIRN